MITMYTTAATTPTIKIIISNVTETSGSNIDLADVPEILCPFIPRWLGRSMQPEPTFREPPPKVRWEFGPSLAMRPRHRDAGIGTKNFKKV